jgi:hypothetical protein
MQWHWGNIGSFLAGLSTVAIAVGALIRGPAIVRSWLDRQAADADESRARAEALRAEAEERGLERRLRLPFEICFPANGSASAASVNSASRSSTTGHALAHRDSTGRHGRLAFHAFGEHRRLVGVSPVET